MSRQPVSQIEADVYSMPFFSVLPRSLPSFPTMPATNAVLFPPPSGYNPYR